MCGAEMLKSCAARGSQERQRVSRVKGWALHPPPRTPPCSCAAALQLRGFAAG